MRALTALVLAVGLPVAAFAVGSDDNTAPKPTNTTTECKKGEVWDDKTKACVAAESRLIDDDTRYGSVRELAYAGRAADAQRVLATMSDQSEDRVLTYWGFTHRKLGHPELAMFFYDRALAVNPDNLLARSYLGQAHVAEGRVDLARAELTQIRARGGRGTWAELSLRLAIETGRTSDY